MLQNSHRLVVAMATKTVTGMKKKTSFATVQTAKQQLNGNEKKNDFATVQTAKQQLTKKTDHFLFI